MNGAPNPSEKALLWSCMAFTGLALLMIVGPYVGAYLETRGLSPEQAYRGGAAFMMTFGFLIFAVGALSWFASVIMIFITWIIAPHVLRSWQGTFLKIANIAIIAYGLVFLALMP